MLFPYDDEVHISFFLVTLQKDIFTAGGRGEGRGRECVGERDSLDIGLMSLL